MSATTAETNSILKYLSVCCFTQKWNTLHFIYQEPEISLHPAIPFTSIFWIIKLSLNKREFQSTDLFWNWPKFCHLFPALTANTSAHFNCKMACSSFIVRYFHSFDCIAQHTNTFHFMAIFFFCSIKQWHPSSGRNGSTKYTRYNCVCSFYHIRRQWRRRRRRRVGLGSVRLRFHRSGSGWDRKKKIE